MLILNKDLMYCSVVFKSYFTSLVKALQLGKNTIQDNSIATTIAIRKTGKWTEKCFFNSSQMLINKWMAICLTCYLHQLSCFVTVTTLSARKLLMLCMEFDIMISGLTSTLDIAKCQGDLWLF